MINRSIWAKRVAADEKRARRMIDYDELEAMLRWKCEGRMRWWRLRMKRKERDKNDVTTLSRLIGIQNIWESGVDSIINMAPFLAAVPALDRLQFSLAREMQKQSFRFTCLMWPSWIKTNKKNTSKDAIELLTMMEWWGVSHLITRTRLIVITWTHFSAWTTEFQSSEKNAK